MSKNNDINELFSLILSLKTLEDCEILFEDLCTAKELEQMAQRVKAAKLLKEGKTYNQVMQEYEQWLDSEVKWYRKQLR